MLSPKKQACGIEISDASIKIIQLKQGGEYFKLVGYKIINIPDGLVVAGEIKNIPSVAEHIQKALSESKPRKINTAYAVCSLPENKTFVRILDIPKMPKEELAKGIKWQAEQYIPLSIESVYLDWQIIEEHNNKLKILISAAPKKSVDNYIETAKKAKLKPLVMDLEEAAEARALVSQQEQNKASLIVDIGSTKTVFVIQDKQIVPFASNTTEVSGNKFTQVIAKELRIKPEQAEAKKRACCSSKLTEEEKKLLQALSPMFDVLANEILKIIDYYQNHFPKGSPVAQIILCGGGAGLSSIIPHLTLKTKKKIVLGNPLVNIPSKKPLAINQLDLLRLTTTIGLAIRGANIQKYRRQ